MTSIARDRLPTSVLKEKKDETKVASSPRVPRLRWSIGVLLGVGVLINYFDRINLSVAAPQLKHDFGLTDGELGWLFSGFFWSYALLQIPTGMILDRFGVTSVNRVSTFFWSFFSTVTAFASGFGSIFGARILLGVAEAPGFPASSKATGYWFPRQERAFATSIFDAAAKFSNVIGVPLVALAVVHFGWRWGFGITGALSFLYFLAFVIVYRDPSQHPRLGAGWARRSVNTSAWAEPRRKAPRRAASSAWSAISCAIGRCGD